MSFWTWFTRRLRAARCMFREAEPAIRELGELGAKGTPLSHADVDHIEAQIASSARAFPPGLPLAPICPTCKPLRAASWEPDRGAWICSRCGRDAAIKTGA